MGHTIELNESNPTVKVLFDIIQERERQDAKWGKQLHSSFKWLAILTEEVGEVAKAMLDVSNQNEGTVTHAELVAHLREELVQVAAVAVEIVEAIDEGQQHAETVS